jgi:hypothetical protein
MLALYQLKRYYICKRINDKQKHQKTKVGKSLCTTTTTLLYAVVGVQQFCCFI